jgi:aldose 1-epimerase
MLKSLVFSMVCMAMSVSISQAKTTVTSAPFGKFNGTSVEIYTLNSGPVEARIMTYGGILVSLRTLDRNSKMADVVLGFDSLDGYVSNFNGPGTAYFGALIGRYANRIGHASFTLDGKKYQLSANNNGNTLHGGPHGYFNVVWKGKEIPDGVELTYFSKDGEEGYPGNLTATVRYTLVGSDLKVDYSATTDKNTVVNLTNHTYFNLAGQGNILQHQLKLNASRFTPVDAGLIPTGELKSVAGTPFDFRKATAIGERIDANDEQIHLGKGYDHNWVLNNQSGKLAEAAVLYDPSTGRQLRVLTTEPGVQFYSGNFLEGTIKGKGGTAYALHSGMCLETQHYPDSPNHPDFPSTELKPGKPYHTQTVFSFSSR